MTQHSVFTRVFPRSQGKTSFRKSIGEDDCNRKGTEIETAEERRIGRKKGKRGKAKRGFEIGGGNNTIGTEECTGNICYFKLFRGKKRTFLIINKQASHLNGPKIAK